MKFWPFPQILKARIDSWRTIMLQHPLTASCRRPLPHSSQSHSYKKRRQPDSRSRLNNPPDSIHQTINKKLVFLCGRFLSRIPDLAIAAFHQPSLQVHGMLYERIFCNNFCIKTFKRCMEICDAVLCEETNEVQTTNGVFALWRWKGFTEIRVSQSWLGDKSKEPIIIVKYL